MSLFTKLLIQSHLRQTQKTAVRSAGLRADGWWIPEHKPMRYPETEEERYRAALRYGIRPEDYRVLDPTVFSTSVGEYPHLEEVTYGHRDPYEDWSHPDWRRNFGEPLPKQFRYDYKLGLAFNGHYKDYPIKNLTFEPEN